MRTKRLLYVTYYHPSGGGSGTHRTARLARGLAALGWDVAVLCGPTSTGLREGLPEPYRTVSTYSPFPRRRAERGSGDAGSVHLSPDDRPSKWRAAVRQVLHVPDPQLFWVPFAFFGVRRALAGSPIAAIFCSGPPFSSFLLGLLLRAWFRSPLILDYRDVWLDHPWWPAPRWRRGFEAWLEGRALKGASLVVVNHEAMRKTLLNRHPRLDSRCLVLPNGFDSAELGDPVRPCWTSGERFEIVYAGAFYGPVGPSAGAPGTPSVQRPVALFEALATLARRGVFGPGGVRATFIGARPGSAEASTLAACARDCGVGALVNVLPRVEKSEVIPWLRRAHLLLNVVYDTEAQVTQKIYEYLHLEIPVLSLIRNSEVNAAIARRARSGPVVDPGEPRDIAQAIEDIVREYARGRCPVAIDRAFVDQFDAMAQVRRLDARLRDVLNALLGNSRGR